MPNGRKSFSKAQISHTFAQLKTIPGKKPTIWRKDRNNKIICFPSYGDDKSKYGWNIHHINLDANVESIKEMYDNLEAVHYETHKSLHASTEELNRIKAVNYILSLGEITVSGVTLPNAIILNDLEGPYMDNNEIAELLADHIKKGRK